MLVSLFYDALMFAMWPLLSKSALHEGVGRTCQNVQTNHGSKSDLIYTTWTFWALHLWKGQWGAQESTLNLTVKWNLWSKWRWKTTVKIFEDPVKKRTRRSWCLTSKSRLDHVITAQRSLKKIRCQSKCSWKMERELEWSTWTGRNP